MSTVAAGLTAVLSDGERISCMLREVTDLGKHAPRKAIVLLDEMCHITEVLSSLQYLLSNQDFADNAQPKALKVEMLLTVLTGCVATFLELQGLIEDLRKDAVGTLDLGQWKLKDSLLGTIIVRLQTHHSSLSLIVEGILNG